MNKNFQYLNWHANRRFGKKVVTYQWLNFEFFPILKKCEITAKSKLEISIVSNAYYYLGDFYFYLRANELSLMAYKKSFKIDPTHTGAFREYCYRLLECGKRKEALFLLENSLLKDPGNLWLLELNEDFRSEHLYEQIQKEVDIISLLANGRAEKVLNLLKQDDSIQGNIFKANAYGINANESKIIECWHKISLLNGDVQFSLINWHCIYASVKNNSDFWEILLNCVEKISIDSVWLYQLIPTYYACDDKFANKMFADSIKKNILRIK